MEGLSPKPVKFTSARMEQGLMGSGGTKARDRKGAPSIARINHII